MIRHERRWPIRPPQLPDEALSSWISRTAVANGLSPLRMFLVIVNEATRLDPDHELPSDITHVGAARLVSARIDLKPLPAEIEYLAQRLGVDESEIVAATFRWYPEQMFRPYSDRLDVQVPYPLATHTVFCPECFVDDDEIPYIRTVCRTRLLFCCPTHGLLLVGRCPHCGYGPHPQLYPSAKNFGVKRCTHCNMSMRHKRAWKPIRVPQSAVDAQNAAYDALMRLPAWWERASAHVHALARIRAEVVRYDEVRDGWWEERLVTDALSPPSS